MKVGLGVAAVAVIALIVILGNGSDPANSGSADNDSTDGPADVPSVKHIHGLAVDPQEPSNLYLATHHGLFYGNEETGWERVGAVQDDLMGFTIDSAGERLWSSGHPVGGGNMGVRISEDNGDSWRFLALEGVDFHAMTLSPADGATMWGLYGRQVYESLDAGKSWEIVGPAPDGTFSITPHPADAQALYASGPEGVFRSDDGGRSWTTWLEATTVSIAFPTNNETDVLRAAPEGVLRSTDGGTTWVNMALEPDGVPSLLAIHPDSAETWYVSTFSDAVYKTDDAGGTWMQIVGA